MVIMLCNSLSPSLRSSSPILLTEFEDFGKTKLVRAACRARGHKYTSNAVTSVPTDDLFNHQEFQFHMNEDVFQVKFCINEYEENVEYLRRLLNSRDEDNPIERLMLVDAIQRLGIAHHYQEEIHIILDHHYLKTGYSIHGYYSLHDIALSFRLFRQRGYHVSPDVFNKFKGKDGWFNEKLREDISGLLELYEATQLSVEGENILDEAEDISRQLLYEYCWANMDNKYWSNIFHMRLKHPYHKSMAMLTNKNFLRDLGGMNIGWRKTLTKVAEMHFIIGQSIYQQELLQVSKWWNDLRLTRELEHARDQPLKWYTWSMAILINNINSSVERVQLTKSIAFIYLIDDTFDLYGTPNELAIFTEALDKWDNADMDMLPDYMKTCFKALVDMTNEIGRMIYEKHGYNPINSLKQTWGSLCNAFLVEAKWFTSGNLPSADEYLANGKVSSGVHVVLVQLFFLLGLDGSSESAIHLDDTSALISCVATILRLWDDLGSAKDEHQNGKDGSYIECYMKDQQGRVPYSRAREHVVNMIASEWKCLNNECFHLNHSSVLPFKEASLNLARMVPLMYNYDNNQRLPILEEYVNFMLLNPVSFKHHQTKQEQDLLS